MVRIGFDGVFDQVVQDLTQLLRIRPNAGQSCFQLGLDSVALVLPAFIERENFFDQMVQIDMGELDFGCARVVAEFVHHVLQCGDLIDDGARTFFEKGLAVGVEFFRQFDVQALGGELNRCERIFDFVCQTTCDFTPRQGALRGNYGRDVVAYQHPTVGFVLRQKA